VIVPVTAGALDLGAWSQMYCAEFDGQRPKRVIVTARGEELPTGRPGQTTAVRTPPPILRSSAPQPCGAYSRDRHALRRRNRRALLIPLDAGMLLD
jgi:hypothetical protein